MEGIDPAQSGRGEAFEMWMNAPMPMVTLFKTLDITPLVRLHRRKGYKLNMLLCWCIGKAAVQTEEFYLLPVAGAMAKYDKIALNVVVATGDRGINTCDVPFCDTLEQFERDYLHLTERVRDTGAAYELGEDYMVIGTSALADYEIDGAVNIYAGVYNNPFLIWGKYRRKLWRSILPISFQFHHVQMDGVPAARFLDLLQREIDRLH